MSRFTFTLALAMTAVFAFGQRATTQFNFAKNNSIKESGSFAQKKNTSVDKSINLNILWEETFDAYNHNNTNGAPDGWVINSTATDTINQWRLLVDHGATFPEMGDPWGGAPSDRDEVLISPEIPVNATVPALWIDISTSYYWFVDQNSDDAIISVSTDDFATETIVWKEDDQTLVEASGMPWPYTSFERYTAKIDLSAWAGQNIKVKFHLVSIGSADGTKGVSFYFDNIKSVETPGNDLEMRGAYAHAWYEYGIYTIMPWDEVRGYSDMGAVPFNAGTEDAVNVTFTTTLDNGGNAILQKDTNYFTSGNQTLAPAATDTFRVTALDNFDMFSLQAGDYTVKQTVTMEGADDNPNNNTYSFPVTITNDTNERILARETRVSTRIGADMFGGSIGGDEMGVQFVTMRAEHVSSVTGTVYSGSSEGTTVRAKLYHWDSATSAWVLLESSDDYDITAADLGNQINLPFLNGGADLDSLNNYMVTIATWWVEGSTNIEFLAYDAYQNEDMYKSDALYIQNDATWYYTGSGYPVLLIHFDANTVTNTNNVSVNNNVNVYPNPSTGLLNINNLVENSTIRVYNMLGAEVATVNNASEFNTIDLSSQAEGTYLVKIFSNNNVIVKKVNLVK